MRSESWKTERRVIKVAWYNEHGKMTDTVISTRVRLARNLVGYPFPAFLEATSANELIEKVGVPLEEAGFRKINFADISAIMATSYVERHYASPAFATSEGPHALFLQEKPDLAVMVCEEDHLRIQSILSGFDPQGAYQNAAELERRLDREFDFAFDESLGYLTQCPTNLGTAMRVSVMMFLPALSAGSCIGSLAVQLSKLGLTLRGAFGEGSGSIGGLYQISNRLTLGYTEGELIRSLTEAVIQISERERRARKAIRGESLDKLTDRIKRSEGAIRYAYMLSAKELIRLLSDLRLGLALGIVSGIRQEQLTSLLVEGMPATLTLSSENTPRNELTRDKLRAQKAQSVLVGG